LPSERRKFENEKNARANQQSVSALGKFLKTNPTTVRHIFVFTIGENVATFDKFGKD
jgi:hypothetical protein